MYVIIKNNSVFEFGVESISKWVVKYPSNDEMRIVNRFKNRHADNVKQIIYTQTKYLTLKHIIYYKI